MEVLSIKTEPNIILLLSNKICKTKESIIFEIIKMIIIIIIEERSNLNYENTTTRNVTRNSEYLNKLKEIYTELID